MGAYSQMDAELRYGGAAFVEDEDEDCLAFVPDDDENAAVPPNITDDSGQQRGTEPVPAAPPAPESEQSAERVQAETQPAAKVDAMTDEEVLAASMKRVGADTEKLTRRNMMECIMEHIQTLCLDDTTFARKVMHPRKNMIRCYQWAVDYFNDPDAKEDHVDEDDHDSKISCTRLTILKSWSGRNFFSMPWPTWRTIPTGSGTRTPCRRSALPPMDLPWYAAEYPAAESHPKNAAAGCAQPGL